MSENCAKIIRQIVLLIGISLVFLFDNGASHLQTRLLTSFGIIVLITGIKSTSKMNYQEKSKSV